MVSVASGRHRRLEAEPLSTDEYLPSPAGMAGPPAGATGMWGPGPGEMAGPQASGMAAPPANGYLTGPTPDWPPDLSSTGPFSGWNAPPPDLPSDHPSAPQPRVRAPRAGGPGGPGGGQGMPDGGTNRLPVRRPGSPAQPRPGRTPGQRSRARQRGAARQPGRSGLRTAGLQPAGPQSAGPQPAGLRATELRATGPRPAELRPAGLPPAGLQPAGLQPAELRSGARLRARLRHQPWL